MREWNFVRHNWNRNRETEEHMWAVRIDRWHPTRLNELLHCHWAEAARRKRFDRDLLCASVAGAGVPKAERKRRVSLLIVLGPRQRAGDPDCYWKSLLDALARSGAIKDDARHWLELGTVRFERGPERATVIEIEDVMAGDADANPPPRGTAIDTGRSRRRGRPARHKGD